MERRGFLRLFGLGAAGLVLDPERLLWVPGAKRIFDLGGVRLADLSVGNTFLTVDWITNETLRVLEHQLSVTAAMNRSYYGPLVGQTVRVSRPARYGRW